jgi:hypothetical protein
MADQLFALHPILEKCNKHNIQNHHLLKDFKAAYVTMIRNEVDVNMSELNFPTKLILIYFTFNKIHHLQDLEPPGVAVWQSDMSVDQKEGEPTSCLPV